MRRHLIRISPAERGRYGVTGDISIADTGAPILDAARALIESGASPSDELHVAAGDVTILPMTLASLLKPRSCNRPPHGVPSDVWNITH
jgi:hypothetical protein